MTSLCKDHARPGTFADESSDVGDGELDSLADFLATIVAKPTPRQDVVTAAAAAAPTPMASRKTGAKRSRECSRECNRDSVAGGSTSDDDDDDDADRIGDDDETTQTLLSDAPDAAVPLPKRRCATPCTKRYAPDVGDTIELRRDKSLVLTRGLEYRGTIESVRRGIYTINIGRCIKLRKVAAAELHPVSPSCCAACPLPRVGARVMALWRAPPHEGGHEVWMPAVVMRVPDTPIRITSSATTTTSAGASETSTDTTTLLVRVRWLQTHQHAHGATTRIQCNHE